jgi:hypothetical protein
MSTQPRFPLRLPLELRPSFDEDLLPLLPVPLLPDLFLRPLRSFRVRSFCERSRRKSVVVEQDTNVVYVHIFESLERACRRLLRLLAASWPMFARMASTTKRQSPSHRISQWCASADRSCCPPLRMRRANASKRARSSTYKPLEYRRHL